MAEIVNGRCHAEKAPLSSPPLFQHGNLVIQAHHVGWFITGCFTFISTVTSFWLIYKHLQWYSNKVEQRYIVRILLMVPLYAMISFASYLFWNHSTPLLLLRDCYESTVLTSFFYLLLAYLSPDPVEQKEIFRKLGLSREKDRELQRLGQKPKRWMFPLGIVKWKPVDGLYFLQLMKWGILQYCVVRPTTTLVAVILDYAGLYCEDSWSPGWGHIYITAIVSISVSVGMYCLIQLYIPVSSLLKPQKPLLKLFAVKAVVFLTFWQASFLSLLTMFNVVKDTTYMTAENINIGIGAILETFEMMVFAFLHIRAFTYRPYHTPPNRTRRFRALVHAFNFRETLNELGAGVMYIWHKMRGRETDVQARREAALEGVFGRSRIQIARHGEKCINKQAASKQGLKDKASVEITVEETVHVSRERQWLGIGDDGAHDLGYHSKSEGLGEQIERELARKGFALRDIQMGNTVDYAPLRTADPEQELIQAPLRREGSSWWKSMYSRLSQSERTTDLTFAPAEDLVIQHGCSQHRQREFRRMAGHRLSQVEAVHETYDDSPPPSFIRSYRESKSQQTRPNAALTARLISSEGSQSHTPSMPGPVAMPFYSIEPPITSSPTSPASSSDSFLDRAFPTPTDASRSTEVSTAGATSNQSHRSRLQLSAEPTLIPNTVVARSPVIIPHPDLRSYPVGLLTSASHREGGEFSVDPSENPSRRRSSYLRDSAFHVAYPHNGNPPSSPLRVSRRYGVHGNSRRSASTPKPPLLRRDQIVLPAPLAPLAVHSGSAVRTAHLTLTELSLSGQPSPPPPQEARGPLEASSSPHREALPLHSPSSSHNEAILPQERRSVRVGDTTSTQVPRPQLRRQGATRGMGRHQTDTLTQQLRRSGPGRRFSAPIVGHSPTLSPVLVQPERSHRS